MQTQQLPNGMTVLIDRCSSPSIHLFLGLNAGSCEEKKSGLAHLVEHVTAHGHSAFYTSEGAREMRAGCYTNNASTDHHWTNYYAEISPSFFPSYLRFIGSAVFANTIDHVLFKREKKRVVEELFVPQGKEFCKISSLLFGEHHYGRYIAGTPAEVRTLTREDAISFYDSWYVPNNRAILVLTGALPENVEQIVADSFPFPAKALPARNIISLTDKLQQQYVRDVLSPKETVIMTMAFPYPALPNSNWAEAALLHTALAAPPGHTSLLYQQVSTRNALAYELFAGRLMYGDLSYFVIRTRIQPQNEKKVMQQIFSVFDQVKQKQPSLEQLALLKEIHGYRCKKLDDTPIGRTDFLLKEYAYHLSYSDILAKIMAVTPEQIQSLAQNYLPNRETGKYVCCITG